MQAQAVTVNQLFKGIIKMQKIKDLFDNKMTWLGLGSVAGALFGDQAAAIVNAIGSAVMVIL